MDALLLQAPRRLIDLTEAEFDAKLARLETLIASSPAAANALGKLYDVADAAELLGMSTRQLRHLIRLHRIAVIRERRGARVRICANEIARYRAANTQGAVEPAKAPRKRKKAVP